MSNTSFPLLHKVLRPIDPLIVRVLRRVDRLAHSAGIPYFIAGATARDLILVNVHGLWAGRATRDIDFGIAFRGVSSPDNQIAWPPKNDMVMNVASFEEALASSILLAVEDQLGVRVASVPGLTLLKLTAWADRGNMTTKDAIDLLQLVSTYAHAGNLDRLYDQAMLILEAAEFDVQLAGAQLPGRDVRVICTECMEGVIGRLVRDDATFERLSDQAVNSELDSDADFQRRLLQFFRRGLTSETFI